MTDQSAARLGDRRLYLCVPDRPDLEKFVASCIEGGVDIVQLRDHVLEARPLIARALLVRQVCLDYGVPFVMNDRPDLALEVDADGVHVGQDDAPAALARRIVGPDRIVGLSTHEDAEILAGQNHEVDYVSVGPVVPTPTKPGRPATGLGYVERASRVAADWPGRSTPMPFFVTGGVSPESVDALIQAGARRFVVVRYLTESDDPRRAAERLCSSIERSIEQVS